MSLTHNYICRDCALEQHAIYPQGHVATSHRNICKYCNVSKDLLAISDWDWPKDHMHYTTKYAREI